MSHRTSPIFSESSTSFFPNHRHNRSGLHTLFRIHNGCKRVESEDASHVFYEGLDEARFDQVRRAVMSDPTCLHYAVRTHGAAHGAVHRGVSPISYALANCRTWSALAAHCRRTGIGIADGGELTFRERLTAMNAILAWLVAHTDGVVSMPTDQPLHTAYACRLDTFAMRLLDRWPRLAVGADARGRTPLHAVCALDADADTAVAAAAASHVSALARRGADVCARDADEQTPLHTLVNSLQKRVGVSGDYGLTRRGVHASSRSLHMVTSVMDALLLHGASLSMRDRWGRSAPDVALQGGLDYIVLVQRAVVLCERICNCNLTCERHVLRSPRVCARVRGPWGLLPDDLVTKIMSLLSPHDALFGIGATCSALRRVATGKKLWAHLDMAHCMRAMRQ